MASGFRAGEHGAFQSDGLARTIPLDFIPKRVHLTVDTGVEAEATMSMQELPAPATFKRLANGTASFVTTTANLITLNDEASGALDQLNPAQKMGFTVGTDADYNPGSNHIVHWWAEE